MKKTLIFPRLHKVPKPPRINFGIFKPVTRIGKKNKFQSVKKSQEKPEQRPKYEEKNHILKENYSYVEEKNSFINKSKDPNILMIKPKKLYDRLVLDKLKPNYSMGDNNSLNSSYNSEEKKLNKATINKIRIFSDYNDDSTFFTNKNVSSIEKKYGGKKSKKPKDKKLKKDDYKNRNNVHFMNTKDNREIAEEYLEKLVNKNDYYFERDFIDKNIFNFIDKELFMQRLLYEMNKKYEEIPLYLYEDDLYFQSIFEETAFKVVLENLEKNKYLYDRKQVILPQVVDYHNYLRDFTNMYNAIGGELYLDELYDEEIYINNKKLIDEEEKIRENKRIKNIIKNKKLTLLSEKFKNYLKKNQRLSKSFNINKEKNSKFNESLNNNNNSFYESYLNIIPKVVKNRKKFNLKYGNLKNRRSKKLSLEKSELISIERMVGGRIRTEQNKGRILFNDDEFETKNYKRKIRKSSSLFKDYKYKWNNNENSFLDCPELYERPKRKNLINDEIKGLFNENKVDKKKKNKRTKSMYNKYFRNKFKLYK